eukprot:m.44918 g.44918  ORF g.44918 m.44918 type:complete len:164 (+) comp19816_c0_seq1:2466-2957(+)
MAVLSALGMFPIVDQINRRTQVRFDLNAGFNCASRIRALVPSFPLTFDHPQAQQPSVETSTCNFTRLTYCSFLLFCCWIRADFFWGSVQKQNVSISLSKKFSRSNGHCCQLRRREAGDPAPIAKAAFIIPGMCQKQKKKTDKKKDKNKNANSNSKRNKTNWQK